MWKSRRSQSLLILVGCLALIAAPGFAEEVDLSSEIAGPATASGGEEVTYSVTYSNHSATDPKASAVNLEFPLGMFMAEDDETEFFYADSLDNSFGLFINSSCDGLLIQGSGPDDETPGLTLPAGQSGTVDVSFVMPMQAPGTPFFQIDSPNLFPDGIEFGARACENECADCLGPSLVNTAPPVQAELVMADDGTDNPTWGCEFPWVNDVTGKIAVIRRGECEFGVKALNANDSGAVGFILLNRLDPTYDSDGVIGMLPGSFGSLVTIPGVSTTPGDGDIIENAINAGTVVASMGAEPNADNTMQFDSVIFHFQDGARPAETDPNEDNDEDSMTTTLLTTGEAPVASFTSAAVDLTVDFTDTSTNSPTSWAWDFGDGGSSTEQNPSYTYAAGGTYTVSLTATNAIGSDTATADVTVNDSSAFTCTNFAVAAAGSAPGAGTSQWATDLGVNNLGDTAINYKFQFLPRGADNSAVEMGDLFTLEAGKAVGYKDIWNSMVGSQGFGAMNVCVDDPANAGVIARVYNTNDVGTFGQAMVGIPADPTKSISTGEKVRLGFLSQNDDLRTNIGFMNLGGATITVKAEFFTSDGISLGTDQINILPFSNDQWNRAFTRATSADVAFGYVDVWTETAGAEFLTYASIVDNGTDDPTTAWPFEFPAAKAGETCTKVWIAAAGSAPGAGTSQWATDLGINNLSGDTITYQFQFLPRKTDNTGVALSDPFTLGANMSIGYTDIWKSLTGTEAFGAMNVCVDNAANAGVIARVYNTGDEGTFGQSIVGETGSVGKFVSSGETARLGFLSQNDDLRTNIGFMNAGAESITVDAEFFTADAVSLGTDSITLAPFSNDQWNRAFTRVTGDDVNFGYVDVSSATAGASFITYGSIVDNGTDDPTTISPF